MASDDGWRGMSFPLPLTPFEQYMVKDHHRAYPMIFVIRLHFEGRVDPARLERAQRAAMERHPLLGCRLREVRRDRHAWVPKPDDAVQILEAPCALFGESTFPRIDIPDLTSIPAVQTCISRGTAHDSVAFLFVHAACDGLGAVQFLSDLLSAYHHECDVQGLNEMAGRLEPAALLARHRRTLTWSERLQMLPKQVFGIEGARQFFIRYPHPIIEQTWPILDAEPPPHYPTVAIRHISRELMGRLRQRAREANATTHELIMRDLFLTLAHFRKEQGQHHPNRWLRINVPVNLRRHEHRATPAANIVSMVFICRKPKTFSDPEALLRSLHAEMSRIKRYDVKYAYLNFSRILHKLPRGYDLVKLSRKCHSTAVLTNLGRIFDNLPMPHSSDEEGQHRIVVGDMHLIDFDLTAPLRPLCNVAFAISDFGGRQTLTLHYDHHVLTSEQGNGLIDGLMRQLEKSANSMGSKQVPLAS